MGLPSGLLQISAPPCRSGPAATSLPAKEGQGQSPGMAHNCFSRQPGVGGRPGASTTQWGHGNKGEVLITQMSGNGE